MWARIGSLQILSKHLENATRCGRGGVGCGRWGGEGVGGCGHALAGVWARIGSLLILSKHSENATRCG